MLESLLGLEHIYSVFDDAAQELSEKIGKPLCVSGCGRCCESVFAHKLEAVYAVSTTVGDGNLRQLADRAEGWLLERHKQATTYNGPIFGKIKESLNKEIVALSKVPCPFLLEDKSCLVYRGRPLVCRAYGVMHIPGPFTDFCPRPYGKGETTTSKAYIDIPEFKDIVAQFYKEMVAPEMRMSGWFVSAIFKQLRPQKWKEYIADNRIASVKLLGMPDTFPGMVWQEDFEYQSKIRLNREQRRQLARTR